MSKIVFFCIPAHGHTNPTLGVVRELILRGHQVWYYSYDMLREKIESTGATFISCDKYDSEQKLNPRDAARIGKDLAFSTKILVDTTLALDDKVCSEIEKLKPDCIVADSMALWGKAVAMKLGIPYVCSTTTFAFNQHSSKIMKRSFVEILNMILSMPKITKHIKRLQNKGYPIENILDILGSDANTQTIVYTSPEFQPYSETFSDKYAFVGPSIRTASVDIDKTKDKLIYISMGTVNNDMLSFYKACTSALSETKYQVIISVGNQVSVDSLGELPSNISVYQHVDQIAVLSKADVFISHCGMNSVSESLFFEVPLVMIPQTSEQKGVAFRVLELGAGIELKKKEPKAILTAVEQILQDENYKKKAKEISKTFKSCASARGAADKILNVCNQD